MYKKECLVNGKLMFNLMRMYYSNCWTRCLLHFSSSAANLGKERLMQLADIIIIFLSINYKIKMSKYGDYW